MIRLDDRLDAQAIEWTTEFLEHNELGLALEMMADALSEDEAAIADDERADMLGLVQRMGMTDHVERPLAYCPPKSN